MANWMLQSNELYIAKKAEKLFIYGLIFIEILIVFFAAPYSGDYNNYKNLLEDIYPSLDFYSLLSFDPIFSITTVILTNIGIGTQTTLFLIAIFSLVIKNIIFIRYRFPAGIAIFYFSSLFWMHELIQIRTALATTFILMAWEFYRINKIKGYLVNLLLSIGSHMSAIVFASLHFFEKLKTKYLLIYFILTISSLFLIKDMILNEILNFNIERINRYYESDLSSDNLGIFTVLNFIVFFQIIDLLFYGNKIIYSKFHLNQNI